MKKHLLFIFAVLLPMLASAEKVEINGIWYNLVSKAKQAEVTFKGDSYNSYSNEYSGSIIIPATVTNDGVQYSVTSIGSEAFSCCSSLTAIILPEGVTIIGSEAFRNCISLTAIILPESVTSIGSEAFSYCSSLTAIVIPKNVKSISYSAFANCHELTDVYCYAEKVPLTEADAFNGSYPEYVTLHVPASSLEAYKATAPWNKFGKYEVIIAQELQTGDTFEYTNSEGVVKTYKVVGENLIENPSFDNGTTGWTGGAGGALTGVDWHSNGGVDDGAYLRLTENAGKGGNGSIGTAWDVEVGKTYVFSFFMKNQTNTAAESPAGYGYIKVSMSNTYRDETLVLQPLPHVDAGLAWTQNTWVVTAEYTSLALCARWLAGSKCFDAFILAEVEEVADTKELEDLLATCEEWVEYFDGEDAKGYDVLKPITDQAYALIDSEEFTAADLNAMVATLKEALLDFRMANASDENTVDVTARYIKNTKFDNNWTDWTVVNAAVNNGMNIRNFAYFEDGLNPVAEINGSPSAESSISQTVHGLPLGYYRFTVQCVMDHSADLSDPESTTGAIIFCNGSELDMKTQQMTAGGAARENSYPETFSVIGYVTDNKIEVGFKGMPNSNFSYVAIDNIRLEYLGDRVISFSDCGPNLKWSLEKGKLLIEGEGAMYDFSSESEVPWIENQKEITDVVLTHGVSSIGEFAFSGCTNLSSITIPASVNKIGKHAFSSCSSLTSVTIPEGVTSIEDGTFSNCSKLTSIVIPSSITCIEQNAFRACLRLESVAIPNSVTDIGNSAFAFCYNLENLTIGNSVTNIEECAFQACGLKSLEIPNSVKTLGRAAFAGCSKLTSIIIPKSITNIGDNPFSDCPGLESIIVEEANSVYDSRNNCNAIIHKETNVLISGCKNTIIPNGVTRIGNSAFHNCDGLTSIVIPNSVTTIGNMAFCACDGLTSIVIPNSVTTIGNIAFENSSRDKGLNHVTIGSNVTSIGVRAFDCYSITSIKSLIPSERLFGLYNNVFDTRVNKNKCTLFVPQDAINKYKNTDGWKDFTNIQEITNKVTYIINGEIFAIYDVAYGTNIPKPSKEEHTLICDEIPETMPAEDITIIGSFIANKYLVTFKIGDEVIAADSIEYGAVIITPEAPEKEGYTFNGWGEIPETMPAKDITITGTFIANKYLITFMIDGVVVSSELLEYGSTITAPNAPEREGYTFNGWGEVAVTVPAGDVTYEGSYSVNSYFLTFVVDGEIMKTESVPYGTAIVAPEPPVKEGHTFSGWSDVPATMPASDVTIKAIFTVNKYLVTFMVDDIVLASDSLEYGTKITSPSTLPNREGYTFSGWGDVAETVPANDVTYIAYYIANVYKVYYFVGAKLVNIVDVAYGEPIPEYIYEPEEGYTFLGWVGDTYETMPAHDVTYTANIESGFNQITIDNGQLNIYDLMGRKLEVDDLEELSEGIYIINGRKVVVKIGM